MAAGRSLRPIEWLSVPLSSPKVAFDRRRARELAPIRDLHDLEEQGVRQDALVWAEDRHYAGANRRLHEPFAVE